MVARMRDQGHDVVYYENIEGGHSAAADNKQEAFMEALAYTFLWNELNRPSDRQLARHASRPGLVGWAPNAAARRGARPESSGLRGGSSPR